MKQGSPPEGLSTCAPADLVKLIWGERASLSASEMSLLGVASMEEAYENFVRVRWINFSDFDVCSLRVSGPGGDEVPYRSVTFQRLLPRTFFIPWSRSDARFDLKQAVTGLLKIGGMQDEGVEQTLNLSEINQRCEGGETLSMEKLNGKACVVWVRSWAGVPILGVGSKTVTSPSCCLDISRPLLGELGWKDWVVLHLTRLKEETKRADDDQVVRSILRCVLSRLSGMDEVSIRRWVDLLKSGVTLCGELEEGGRHIIPSGHRTVFFCASRLTHGGVSLDHPLKTLAFLEEVGFQSQDELGSVREPFQSLSAQPRSLQLGTSLREGSVRYFLSPAGEVVAAMKIKDPHYMFYRKLRNAMISSVETPRELLKRLGRSTKDPYYLNCLREAGIPEDFTQVMMRAAASFLAWFVAEPDLGHQFKLAGFNLEQVGLGALITRWRNQYSNARLGEYHHARLYPEFYRFPEEWVTRPTGGRRIAMLALHGAQGSGKSTLSQAATHTFNLRNQADREGVNPIGLALPAEQDPLQNKRSYLTWLERAVLAELRGWLRSMGYLSEPDDALPHALLEPLTWERVSPGKPGARFIQLLEGLCASYEAALRLLGHIDSAQPLLIVNARCNQDYQATQRWTGWLEEQECVGLATLRLSAPIEVLRARILGRGREGDEILATEPLERVYEQVQSLRYIDRELDATEPTEALVSQTLPLFEVALNRVHDQWQVLRVSLR